MKTPKEIEYTEMVFEDIADSVGKIPETGAYKVTYDKCDVIQYFYNGIAYHPTLPAIKYSEDSFDYYNEKGQLHRLKGEARSLVHRDSIQKEFWINGKQFRDEKEYWRKLAKMKVISGKEAMLRTL